MSEWIIVQRLVLITVLAGCIGYERERHGRAAGLRTHILVGLGSCLIMLTGLYLMEALRGQAEVDPTRMAAQVVSGIGFLGAGTILQYRASVRGLTTAASLWAVAGLGLAVGSGFLFGAVASTIIVLVALFGFTRLDRWIRKDWFKTLVVEGPEGAAYLSSLRQLLAAHEVEIRDFDVKRSAESGTCMVELDLKLTSGRSEDPILAGVLRLAGTKQAHWN